MAAEILLEINGHKYNASGFSYDFYQVPDFKGKSVTGIKGGDIHVVLDSSYDNSILETMLSDKTRKVPCVPWEEYEPCPVSGRIQFVQDDVHVFRELAFEEAYITRYKEKMDANGYPMSILLTISTLRLDINKFVRMDRRPETTYGFGWVRFKEKEIEKSPMSKSYAEPMVLVTSVKGKETALPNEKVKYEVTGYNISNVKDKDRKRVKWDIVVDGKQETLSLKGESIEFEMKEEWVGKEIIVMPYLRQPTDKVSVKITIQGLIDVYTQSGKYLFSLEPNKIYKPQRITAKELYKKGIQWFSPTADNYLRLIKMSSNIFTYQELKHFSWSNIVEFSEIDRFMFEYRSNGDGDWKAVGKPGNGYILVTVGGMPYWTDAIGQIPFTLNEFRNCLKYYGDYDLAEKETLRIGKKFGDGNFLGTSDNSNSYDNEMIKRAIKWAKSRYKISGTDSWNKNAIIEKTSYSPNNLSKPL